MVKQLNCVQLTAENHCVTTTKYIEHLQHTLLFLSRVFVKFYCNVIARSRLQLINTSIDTFFSKLDAFLVEQKEQGRPKMVKRKLDGTVDKSSADREIHKSDAIVHNLRKIWRLAPSGTGSYGSQAGRRNSGQA